MWYIVCIIVCIIVGVIVGVIVGFWIMGHICEPTLIKEEFRGNKYTFNFVYSCKWIRLLQEGRSLTQYFLDNNIHEIAIYGIGELGKRLFEDVNKAGITVKYVIDRDIRLHSEKYTLLSPEDDLPEVDIIVVTAAFEFEEIKAELSKKTNAKIISLKEIIDKIL